MLAFYNYILDEETQIDGSMSPLDDLMRIA